MAFFADTAPTRLIFWIKTPEYTSIVFALCLSLFSCSSNNTPTNKEEVKETPVSGTLGLLSDESFRSIVEAERMTFEGLYEKAVIKPVYITEGEVWKSFLEGKTELIFSGRDITKTEREFFATKNTSITSSYFAKDAVALIVNQSFPDSIISMSDLKSLLNGKISSWAKLKKGLPEASVQLVTDQSNSSNLFLLKDSIGFRLDSVKIQAAGSNEKVFDYVREHPWAIGAVSFALLSDTDDLQVKKLLNGIKLLGIQRNVSEFSESAFPSQGTMNQYLLVRNIYVIVRNTKVGLATGFASFLLSERGQRIVLKSGILPAAMPGRQIEIKTN